MENLLKEHGIVAEFFEGVDGREISEELLQAINANISFRDFYGRSLQRGEAGAALSHWNLYKKIVNEKICGAVILEDDVEFDERFTSLVQSDIKAPTLQYDLILLGYCRDDLNYRKDAELSFWKRKKIGAFTVGTPLHWYWAAIGYYLTYKGARLLTSFGDLPFMQADFTTANSPAYGLSLGLLSKPIIWPGSLNDTSTIREEVIRTTTASNSELPVHLGSKKVEKENTVSKTNIVKAIPRQLQMIFFKLHANPYKKFIVKDISLK